MERKRKRGPILTRIQTWLESMGYTEIKADNRGRLRVPGQFGSAQFEIIIRVLDTETIEFIAAYLSLPNGDDKKRLQWEENIFKRRLGTAAINIHENLIVVWQQLRLTGSAKEDKGLLYFAMHSIREYFRCWEYDLNSAEELGLSFGDVDVDSTYTD